MYPKNAYKRTLSLHPDNAISITPQVDFCYCYKEFDTITLTHILSIDSNGMWQCECIDIEDNNELTLYSCTVDPSIDEDDNAVYPVSLDEFMQLWNKT